MTPWQSERWATTPANDGRNYAAAHRWAVVEPRPLCFGRVKTGAGIGELAPGCREEFECRGCLFEGSTLRPSELSLANALLRVYIREAHELREENDKLRDDWSTFTEQDYADAYNDGFEDCNDKLKDAEHENTALRDRIDALEWLRECVDLEQDRRDKTRSSLTWWENMWKKAADDFADEDEEYAYLGYECAKERMDSLKAEFLATFEAARRAVEPQTIPRCPDCGHRLDTEECGCGGDA